MQTNRPPRSKKFIGFWLVVKVILTIINYIVLYICQPKQYIRYSCMNNLTVGVLKDQRVTHWIFVKTTSQLIWGYPIIEVRIAHRPYLVVSAINKER